MHKMNLKDRLNRVHERGFNVSQMINQFKNESKLIIAIPDSVLEKVCEAFDKYKPIKPYPYFKRVLKGECEKYCIQLQKDGCKIGEVNKKGIDRIRELIKGIRI